MEILRNRYLNKLLNRKENGLVKVVTGIRRCGKSYLLFHLYRDKLNSVHTGINSKYYELWSAQAQYYIG